MPKTLELKIKASVAVPDDFRLTPSNYANSRVYFIVTNDDIRCARINECTIEIKEPKRQKAKV